MKCDVRRDANLQKANLLIHLNFLGFKELGGHTNNKCKYIVAQIQLCQLHACGVCGFCLGLAL